LRAGIRIQAFRSMLPDPPWADKRPRPPAPLHKHRASRAKISAG